MTGSVRETGLAISPGSHQSVDSTLVSTLERAPQLGEAERLKVRPAATVVTHPTVDHPVRQGLDCPTGMDSKVYQAITSSPDFRALGSLEQRQKFLDMSASALSHALPQEQSRVTADMLKLLQHRVNGQPALLQRDREGRSLLENLHSIPQGEILINTIRDITAANERISQGDNATCTITVAQSNLAKNQPAEYARIMSGLAAGQVSLFEVDPDTGKPRLSESMVLKLDESALAADQGKHERDITSRLFQAAANNLVAGYDGGLYNDQVERLYEALFGAGFRRIDSPREALAALRENTGAGGVNMVSLRWDVDGAHANHALEVIKIECGRVYFRNPWGSGIPVPENLRGEVRVEDEKRAIYSMSIRDTEKRLNYAMVTDSRAQFGLTAGHDDPADRRGQEKTIFYLSPPAALSSEKTAVNKVDEKPTAEAKHVAVAAPLRDRSADLRSTARKEAEAPVKARLREHTLSSALKRRRYDDEIEG